ncbi:ABC transporter permease subunit [Microvirga sp. VF16]|uniref:ABC transporter permease subunit n=1 Tax=Microvirga sp. VF16 TaxID=2807101 RepID=UPI00193D4DD1|nr:ABC transporter permease subunit [Microvirga sp. VF16]QRM32895.1 ABC transporter permease subunit [Microvirga sp. VF16]
MHAAAPSDGYRQYWLYAGLPLLACAAVLASQSTGVALARFERIVSFFGDPAFIAIGETFLPYSPEDSIAYAILVGMANSIGVTIAGIVLSTVLGTLIAFGILSSSTPLSLICRTYVLVIRSVPLLVQLLLLYALTQYLPQLRNAASIGDAVLISNRGIIIPSVTVEGWAWLLICAGMAAAMLGRRLLHLAVLRERMPRAAAWAPIAILVVTFGISIVLGVSVEVPVRAGFGYRGGFSLSPEMASLIFGLTIYFAAYIAEIVRGGIIAVPRGQWEGAASLGLPKLHTTLFVITPQAVRLILPPLISQFLNQFKASTLAIAIGFPDLSSIVNALISRTGQALLLVLVMMLIYSAISLLISFSVQRLEARLRRY